MVDVTQGPLVSPSAAGPRSERLHTKTHSHREPFFFWFMLVATFWIFLINAVAGRLFGAKRPVELAQGARPSVFREAFKTAEACLGYAFMCR